MKIKIPSRTDIVMGFGKTYSMSPLLKYSVSQILGRLARWRKWRACDVGEAKNGWRMNCTHIPTFPPLHRRHSSFSNPSVALPTSQIILQPFRCFTYVTAHSPNLISLHLRHTLFTYVSWLAAHAQIDVYTLWNVISLQWNDQKYNLCFFYSLSGL